MDAFRFLFLADPQLGCYATFSGMSDEQLEDFAARGMNVRKVPNTTGWDWDAARFSDAIAAANELTPDLVVVGGDMINDVDQPGQLKTFREIAAHLDSIPLYFVPGNHDISGDSVHPTVETTAFYRSAFGDDHYTFGHGGATFVVMNTVLLDQPEALPAESEAHLTWLEAALRDAAEQPGPTLLFGHHPLFVDAPDEDTTYWAIAREGRRSVLDLLRTHGATVVFSGHRHKNASATFEGIELVTSSAVGFPLGDDPSGYRVVDVYPDHIEHEYVAFADQGWD
jgi:3',5'-cyclic AMP phosphodiesterase CpdA